MSAMSVATTTLPRKEEVDLGARRRELRLAELRRHVRQPAFTSPLYSYPHNGRDASITGGFVYHGTQFPSGYQGSYFFADYTQNWIKRMTFDASGNVSGVFNFEPIDGSVDGPYGDIVYLTEGPDGALYYVDLGYSDTSGTFGVSKIRRIRYLSGNQAPIAVAVSESDRWAGASCRQLLERGLVGSRGPDAHIRLDVRRRWHVDGGKPEPHVHATGPVLGAALGLGRCEHDVFDAGLDQRRQPADGDDPVAAGRQFLRRG